jgi:hypothetical protein
VSERCLLPRPRAGRGRSRRLRVRGTPCESVSVESPPHPNPLPASGARERRPRFKFQTASHLQTHVRILATPSARGLPINSALSYRGRRECRAPDAPAAACAKIESKKHTRQSGHTGITRHSLRNGFNGFLRALPGDRAFLPPSPVKIAFHELDASVGASGPHDFSVRFRTVRYRRFHVHRIPSRVRDDREPPLEWDRTAANIPMIWYFGKTEYFLGKGWTGRPAKHRSRH